MRPEAAPAFRRWRREAPAVEGASGLHPWTSVHSSARQRNRSRAPQRPEAGRKSPVTPCYQGEDREGGRFSMPGIRENILSFNGSADGIPIHERGNNRKGNAPVPADKREERLPSRLKGDARVHLTRKIKKTEHGPDSRGLSRAPDGCGPRRGIRRAVDGRSGGSPPMTLERGSARAHLSQKIKRAEQSLDSCGLSRVSDGCGPRRGIRRAVEADGRSCGENARLQIAQAVRRGGRRAADPHRVGVAGNPPRLGDPPRARARSGARTTEILRGLSSSGLRGRARVDLQAQSRDGSADGRRLLNVRAGKTFAPGARGFSGLTFETLAGGRLPTLGARAGM